MAISKEAIITMMVLSCRSSQVGQVTLLTSSSVDSLIYSLILFIALAIARVERFELPSTVLETAILPLNYTRRVISCFHFFSPLLSSPLPHPHPLPLPLNLSISKGFNQSTLLDTKCWITRGYPTFNANEK